MVLTVDDVILFINNDLTEHFKKMECPDEHYFVNILNNIFKKKFFKKQKTNINIIFRINQL